MDYYKVIKNGKVIDVLDRLVYVKIQKKHGIPVNCDCNEAEGIISSDGKTIWHEETLYKMPTDKYDTVRIEPIDKYEYKQLKMLNCCSVQEILEQYTLSLIEGGIL